jgi:hypothetical protein
MIGQAPQPPYPGLEFANYVPELDPDLLNTIENPMQSNVADILPG